MYNEVIRLLRIANDMTIKELAEKMGLRNAYICDVERCRRNPSLETLEKYSLIFGIPLSQLMIFDEKREKLNLNYSKLLQMILQYYIEKEEQQDDKIINNDLELPDTKVYTITKNENI